MKSTLAEGSAWEVDERRFFEEFEDVSDPSLETPGSVCVSARTKSEPHP